MSSRMLAMFVSRRFSSSGKILSEEKKAAENVYIKVLLHFVYTSSTPSSGVNKFYNVFGGISTKKHFQNVPSNTFQHSVTISEDVTLKEKRVEGVVNCFSDYFLVVLNSDCREASRRTKDVSSLDQVRACQQVLGCNYKLVGPEDKVAQCVDLKVKYSEIVNNKQSEESFKMKLFCHCCPFNKAETSMSYSTMHSRMENLEYLAWEIQKRRFKFDRIYAPTIKGHPLDKFLRQIRIGNKISPSHRQDKSFRLICIVSGVFFSDIKTLLSKLPGTSCMSFG